MPISEKIRKITDEMEISIGMKGKRGIGVLCRGTDYVKNRPFQHAVQPSPEKMIQKTLELMEQYKYEYCYLATEDEEVIRKYQEALGDRLLYSQKTYYEGTDNMYLNEANKRWNVNAFRKNEEYLVALLLLARCKCFLTGRTSGAVLTMLYSNSIERFFAWNEGSYGVDDWITLENCMI